MNLEEIKARAEKEQKMNRLTKRLENGVVKRTDVDDNNRGDSVMLRLAAYEDTGLSPEEVMEIKGKAKS